MALDIPLLDNRTFQQIVDEARKRIPHYTPEWTDHNVSDPGITLIEVFAWMAEMLLYRMNQMPDLHYVKFMEMFGVHLQAPQPAHVAITFWLTKEVTVTAGSVPPIKAGTEVSTVQTESQVPVIFTTDQTFVIQAPKLRVCLTATGTGDTTKYVAHNTDLLLNPRGKADLAVFSHEPQIGDAFYWGFENDLSFHLLRLTLHVKPNAGTGIDNRLPPLEWQAWSGADGWVTIAEHDIEIDEIQGFNQNGAIQLHLPQLGRQTLSAIQASGGTQATTEYDGYWLRVQVRAIAPSEAPKMKPYEATPILYRMEEPAVMGCTVAAAHAQVAPEEYLGESDGSPGQRFFLQSTPILSPRLLSQDERLYVRVAGKVDEPWIEVEDFGDARADTPCYVLDSATGELRLGPAVRQADGIIKRYGVIPERGAQLLFRRYRYGGGLAGNVKQGELNTLKTAIPYVKRLLNRQPAKDGREQQSLEAAKLAMPRLLRTSGRAVTAEDFEFLAGQPEVGARFARVKCFQPDPDDADGVAVGEVEVVALAHLDESIDKQGLLTVAQLTPAPTDRQKLWSFLNQRRLLTTRLLVKEPTFHAVSVLVTIAQKPALNQREVRDRVRRQLYAFLNPISGGPDEKGWPWGQSVQRWELYHWVQRAIEAQLIVSIQLFDTPVLPVNSDEEASDEVLLTSREMLISGQHDVRFIQP